MKACEAVRPELPAYESGELSESEAAGIEAHLAGCRECKRELENVRDAAGALRSAPLGNAPPTELRDKVFSLVELEPVADLVRSAPVEHDPPVDLERSALQHAGVVGHRPPGRWQRAATVLAPGLAAAVALLGWLGANWRSDADLARSQLGPLGEPVGSAELTGETSSASGPQVNLMQFARDRYRLVLICDRVPEAPPGHHYAVWLEGDAGSMPIGAFDVVGGTPMAYSFPVAVDPSEFPRLVITLESQYDHPLKPGVVMWAGEIDLEGAAP
jgi:hypothetical protein